MLANPLLDIQRLTRLNAFDNQLQQVTDGLVIAKAWFMIFVMMWIRWTYPRIRLDQVMYLCLKVLLPFAVVCLVGATLWDFYLGDRVLFGILPTHF